MAPRGIRARPVPSGSLSEPVDLVPHAAHAVPEPRVRAQEDLHRPGVPGLPGAQPLQEPHRSLRVPAGPVHEPDRQAVRLVFELAAEPAGDQVADQVPGRGRGAVPAQQQVHHQAQEQVALQQLHVVAGLHVGHLVREDERQLGVVRDESQQPAGHVDVPARQRYRVHLPGSQHAERPRQARPP